MATRAWAAGCRPSGPQKFGPEQSFGVYASAFYDKRNYANSEMAGVMAAQNDGGWSYLIRNAAGASYPGIDPEKNITQTGLNIGVSNGYTERWGGNFTLNWRPDDTLDAYLRGSYAFAKTQQNSTSQPVRQHQQELQGDRRRQRPLRPERRRDLHPRLVRDQPRGSRPSHRTGWLRQDAGRLDPVAAGLL
ncbi:hypothetical protein ACRAWD_00945 [Caulobacter segnis]